MTAVITVARAITTGFGRAGALLRHRLAVVATGVGSAAGLVIEYASRE
jgi:hypothetical protein